MNIPRLMSADSHTLEPADLWTQRLDPRFADRAPRVVKNPSGSGVSFVAPGIFPFPLASLSALGKGGEKLKRHMATSG